MRSGNSRQLSTWLSACLLTIFVLTGCGTKAIPEKDIVDTAVAAGDFNTLVAGANVAKTGIECSNGVIHVIDAVVLP